MKHKINTIIYFLIIISGLSNFSIKTSPADSSLVDDIIIPLPLVKASITDPFFVDDTTTSSSFVDYKVIYPPPIGTWGSSSSYLEMGKKSEPIETYYDYRKRVLKALENGEEVSDLPNKILMDTQHYVRLAKVSTAV